MGLLSINIRLALSFKKKKWKFNQNELTILISTLITKKVHIKIIKRILLKKTKKSIRLIIQWTLSKTNVTKIITNCKKIKNVSKIILLRTNWLTYIK